MAMFESFLPNSLFGVPLHPFPPGIGWENTLEMLREILADLQIHWAQNYILRSHPQQDVHAFNDKHNYLRRISRILECKTIPQVSGGFASKTRRIRLQIPVISVDDIGVGIAVSKSEVEGSGGVIYSKPFEFSRFVSNKRRNSELFVSYQEDHSGKISCSYYSYKNGGLWLCILLTFDYKKFINSFDGKTSRINFHSINQSLISSVIGGVQHHQKPSICVNHLYPNNVADNTGDHFLRGVITACANGQPMMSIPAFAHASWLNNASDVTNIRNWAINDRLQRIKIHPASNLMTIPAGFLFNPEHEKQGLQTRSVSVPLPAISRASACKIAPLPISIDQVQPSGSDFHPPISQLQLQADDQNARKELRKIRKREAAARSYRRKAANIKKK